MFWPLALLGVAGMTAVLHPTEANHLASWIVCLCVGLAIPFVRDLPASWFTRCAHVICEYSYGIYLTHIAALWLAFVVYDGPLAAQIGLFAGLTAAFSFVAYHAIEAPGTALGKRLASRIRAALQAPGAGPEAALVAGADQPNFGD